MQKLKNAGIAVNIEIRLEFIERKIGLTDILKKGV